MTISDLLIQTRGNQSAVARMLKIERSTLSRYMKLKIEHFVLERDGQYALFANISEQYGNK